MMKRHPAHNAADTDTNFVDIYGRVVHLL